MLCKSCGSQLEDNAAFCGICGAKAEAVQETAEENSTSEAIHQYFPAQRIQDAQPAQTESYPAAPEWQQPPDAEPEKKKSKKPLIITVIVIVAVLAAAAAAFILFAPKSMLPSFLSGSVSRFETAIEEDDFALALQIYNDNLAGDEVKQAEAADIIINRAMELRTSYIDGDADYDTVLAALSALQGLGIVPVYEITPIIEEVNAMRTSRVSYTNAIEKMGSGDYVSAINSFRNVIAADTNYQDAQTQLVNAIRLYKEQVFGEVSVMESDKRYNDAISAIRAALTVVPDDADFLGRISDIEQQISYELTLIIEGIINEAGKKASGGDHEGAIADLESAQYEYPGSSELAEAITALKDDYVTMLLGRAGELAADGYFEEAIELLTEGFTLVPDNALLKAKIADYEEKLPVFLHDMVWFTGDNILYIDENTDNLQNPRYNVITSNFNNVYKLNGEYTRITGTIFQPFDRRNETYNGTLEIYGDGELLYSERMSGGVEPIDFDISLTDVTELRVRFSNSSGIISHPLLADVKLYPAP